MMLAPSRRRRSLRRLAALDWLLLGTLLPLWLGSTALSVWHARAHPPGNVVFFARAESADALPRVDLLRGPAAELRVGDRLVAVGGRDLRGAGHVRVQALSNAARVSDPGARLELLRMGQVLSISLPTVAWFNWSWWAGLAFSTSIGLSGLWLLLSARGWGVARRYFVSTTLWSSVVVADFQAAGGVWTYLGYVTRYALLGPAAAITLWSALEWTPSARPLHAWHKALPWGLLALGVALALNTLVVGSALLQPWLVSALTIAFIVTTVLAFRRCHRRADAGERRQLRWIFVSFGIALTAMLALPFVVLTTSEGSALGATLLDAMLLCSISVPIGFVISIVGYGYLDIDRLISGTVAGAILAAGLAAVALSVIPPTARTASDALGVEPSAVQLVLSMALAALLVPGYQWVHPRVERRLFPEREQVDAGFARLLDELSACQDASELTRVVSEGIDALLRPESVVTYAREGEAYTPVFARGRALPPAFDASTPLVSALRSRIGPLAADRFARQAPRPLSPFDRAALDTLDVAVLSPTLRRGELIAFQCLGPKRSGDVYTATDLALLAAAASKVADLLARFDDTATLREARQMQAALRRYVPGAVVRELGDGAELPSGEREVSVLFVDIRGYTQLAERLDAEQVFSTLNRHTEEVSTIVGRHGGSVVEFHGDGLMAVFGAPRAIDRKEACAVAAAREVIGALQPREISVGIGVATGSAYVGDIQAADRRIWSVVGNTTNLAARLQALTRDLDAAIAVDAPTREWARSACAGFLLLPSQRIRGRSEPIDLWVLPLDSVAETASRHDPGSPEHAS
jgi:class 3 adenylate cyclase